MAVMSRLTAIFSLQAVVLALSISTAIAETALHDIHPDWLFPSPPEPEITANYVMTTLLPQLIGPDQKLSERLGFSSLAAINSLVLPDPAFAVFRVGLSRLKSFDPLTSSPLSLFLADENWHRISPPPLFPPKVMPVRFLFAIRESSRPASGCTYPSLVDIPIYGCVASSVQVKRVLGTWEFQQIGRPELIKTLTKFGNGGIHFVAWFPVLNLHYLARLVGSDLKITAIAEVRFVKNLQTGIVLAAGEEIDGVDVIKQLQQEVQTIAGPNIPPG